MMNVFNNKTELEIINELKLSKFLSESIIAKRYPDFYNFIKTKYNFDISWKEKLYLHTNNVTELPNCYCGNKLEFLKGKYKEYCSVKCASNSPKTKEKIKKTSIEKYGSHFSKTDDFKTKVKKTSLDRFGVENVSKLQSTKDKVKKTNQEKFGVDYVSQLDSVKESLSTKMKETKNLMLDSINRNMMSNLIERVSDFNIKINDINFTHEYIYNMSCHKGHIFDIHRNTLKGRIDCKVDICTVCNKINTSSNSQDKLLEFISEHYKGEIIKNNRSIIGKEIDIYLPELKLGFEYNGLYWHSDVYKDKNYHLDKTNKCFDNSIRLIHIWEDDWLHKTEIVKSQLLNLFYKSNKIFARKCIIKEVSVKETRKFLDNNHIQGFVSSKFKIGLYYNNDLVSIMTFDSFEGRKKMYDNEYNLSRFCNKLGYNVIGGASKLLSYFTKTYLVTRVISYADKDWSVGNLYYTLGFNNIGGNGPDYKYVVGNKRVHKSRYKKSNLKIQHSNFTESKTMKELGINRIYDCGKIKFEKYIL